ncbi:glycosyltransferase [Rubrivirga sp. IMCC43871]|uniref:glycosyltransferase n=1 Tax=Rubrivirga sp. IMCC43871 TaxID=3391575 RepID=UPI00398FFEB9
MHVSPAPPLLAPATATVDVSVVIVTYNVREFLEQALRSVEAASAGLSVETFVVDNDSADGSVEMVRERFPDVRVIANEANVGFATANNQAIREAAGRHVLVLNPDTILQEDTLRTLVAFMDDHPDAGAAGCRILNPDGTFAPESRRSFPTPAVAFYRIAGLSKLFPQSPTFGRYNLTHLPLDEVCEVDALSGSCMMVRKAAVLGDGEWGLGSQETGPSPTPDTQTPTPAGLFDEAFFMYGEDLDWCYRIQQAGWRIYYTPDTQIVHYKGESTKKGDLRYVMLFYGAMLRFVEKHVTHRPGAGPLDRLASAGLALGIRLGIIARAAFAAIGRLGRAIAAPATDGALALAALTATAFGWSVVESFQFGASYYAVVLPAYAVALVIAVGLGGGYHSRAMRPVLGGAVLAGLAVAAVSYFVPTVAFSRAVLAFGLALATSLLLARRVRKRGRVPRRALLVGAATEAARLQRLLDEHARGDAVVGYVADAPSDDDEGPAYAGRTRQLRDLARLSGADDVVFAADSLTNTAILDGMRALRELPVQLKILASGRDRVIGKASIEDFAAPLQEAERTVAPLRAAWTRRAVELPVASALLLLSPLFRGLARTVPSARTQRLAAIASRMPSVLAGRRALVGYDADGPHPPPSWGLTPGVVSVLDTRRARPRTIAEAHRAYWFYARHQSAWLDVEILLRALLSGDD